MFLLLSIGEAFLQASLPQDCRAFGAGKAEDSSNLALLSLAERQKWKMVKCADKGMSGDVPCTHAWLVAVGLFRQLQESCTGLAELMNPL